MRKVIGQNWLDWHDIYRNDGRERAAKYSGDPTSRGQAPLRVHRRGWTSDGCSRLCCGSGQVLLYNNAITSPNNWILECLLFGEQHPTILDRLVHKSLQLWEHHSKNSSVPGHFEMYFMSSRKTSKKRDTVSKYPGNSRYEAGGDRTVSGRDQGCDVAPACRAVTRRHVTARSGSQLQCVSYLCVFPQEYSLNNVRYRERPSILLQLYSERGYSKEPTTIIWFRFPQRTKEICIDVYCPFIQHTGFPAMFSIIIRLTYNWKFSLITQAMQLIPDAPSYEHYVHHPRACPLPHLSAWFAYKAVL